jgi:archaemetzincin
MKKSILKLTLPMLFVLFAICMQAEVPTIHVFIYGKVDKVEATRYVSLIHKYYAHVKLESKCLTLPKSAFYAPRKRYLAYTILKEQYKVCPKGDYVIGLTDKDISMNRLSKGKQVNWGIMGLTDYIGGHSCVISSYRVKNKEDLPYLMLHELGHAFGLKHCTNKCLMQDAQGKNKFGYLRTFCPLCKATLKAKGWKI